MADSFFNYLNFYQFISDMPHLRRFVEIGVYTGASVTFLAKRLMARGTPFELYAVDLWDQVGQTNYDRTIDPAIWKEFSERINREGVAGHIRILQKDSVNAAAEFQDKSVDFAFIDANHSYEHVVADINAWLPKIRTPGGILAGHDYGEPCGVKQAVDELLGDRCSLMGTCWYSFIR